MIKVGNAIAPRTLWQGCQYSEIQWRQQETEKWKRWKEHAAAWLNNWGPSLPLGNVCPNCNKVCGSRIVSLVMCESTSDNQLSFYWKTIILELWGITDNIFLSFSGFRFLASELHLHLLVSLLPTTMLQFNNFKNFTSNSFPPFSLILLSFFCGLFKYSHQNPVPYPLFKLCHPHLKV